MPPRAGRGRVRRAGWTRTGSPGPSVSPPVAGSAGSSRRPVARDDGLPRGEAGADRGRLRAPARGGPRCRCRPRRPAGRPEAGAAVADRRAVAPAGTHRRHRRAGPDLHPVAEAGHQRVVQVLEMHHRRRRPAVRGRSAGTGGATSHWPSGRRTPPSGSGAAMAPSRRPGPSAPGRAGRSARAPARCGGGHPFAALQQRDLPAGAGQTAGGGQSGQPRAHHHRGAHATAFPRPRVLGLVGRPDGRPAVSAGSVSFGPRLPAAGSRSAGTRGSVPRRPPGTPRARGVGCASLHRRPPRDTSLRRPAPARSPARRSARRTPGGP